MVTKSLIFTLKLYLKQVGSKTYLRRYNEGTKAFLKGRKPGLFVNLINFHAPGSGLESALQIRIQIQDSQMNTDPDPQHWTVNGIIRWNGTWDEHDPHWQRRRRRLPWRWRWLGYQANPPRPPSRRCARTPPWVRPQLRLPKKRIHSGFPSVTFLTSVVRIRIRIFGPPGSGSVSTRYRVRIRFLLSSSKHSKKNLDSYCFVTSLWILSLKNDVNVAVASNSNKKKLRKGTDPQIRIRTKISRIRNTVSCKCNTFL